MIGTRASISDGCTTNHIAFTGCQAVICKEASRITPVPCTCTIFRNLIASPSLLDARCCSKFSGRVCQSESSDRALQKLGGKYYHHYVESLKAGNILDGSCFCNRIAFRSSSAQLSSSYSLSEVQLRKRSRQASPLSFLLECHLYPDQLSNALLPVAFEALQFVTCAFLLALSRAIEISDGLPCLDQLLLQRP